MSASKIGIVPVLLVLSAVGVFLGPYHMYDKIYRSGESVTSRKVKLDGATTVTLHPEMNPIRITGTVRHGAPRNGGKKTTKFRWRMSDESGSVVQQDTFYVSADAGDMGKASARRREDDTYGSGVKIACFDVETKGAYTFSISRNTEQKRPDFPVSTFTLSVRRNVEMVNKAMAISGFAILLCSFVPACWIVGGSQKGKTTAASGSDLRDAEVREPALSN